MVILIWVCLVIDVALVIFLVSTLASPGQDAAGQGMVLLPILVLVTIVIAGYFLLQKQHLGWAAFLTGLPVIILLYYLFISFT